MEIYNSEGDELQAFAKWWKDNGRSIIIGVVAGITVVIGWNLWQNYKLTRGEQASMMYEQLKEAIDKEDFDTAESVSDKLVELHGKSPYATFAQLYRAKLKVDTGDLEGAKSALEAVIAGTGDDHFRHVARLRLGRVLLANQEYEAGLKLISAVDLKDAKSFEGAYEELRGDLYVGLGRVEEARAAYQKALAAEQGSPLLPMKLDDLGAAEVPEQAG